MDDSKVFAALEELLELDPGTVRGNEKLVDLPGWDSMAVVGFIAMVDETFGVIVPANRLTECRTTMNLAQLVADCQDNHSAK